MTYLSFDIVDKNRKIVYDEGPYGNDFTYNGDVEFKKSNYSCEKAAKIQGDADLYYQGSGFKNAPKYGVTIALWVKPENLLHKQSIFATKSIGSKGGTFFPSSHNVSEF